MATAIAKDIHNAQRDIPPQPINCDNQDALTHVTIEIFNAHTQHINICYHNSCSLHKYRIVNYSYLRMDDNVADILTKVLAKDKHTIFMKAIGLW
jgi:hypothetical protein